MRGRVSQFVVRYYSNVQKKTLTLLSYWKASFFIQPADSSVFSEEGGRSAFCIIQHDSSERNDRTVKTTEQ